ncbi:MAG: T9SS type A sorting domain-containing protein [Carboxylicivirga sp.]|jgi:hypothetical protein|nr:T9SS type A sorting domain-containing protein [Carboxylicivirga sp.]
MKKTTFLMLMACFSLFSSAQTIPAKQYLDFEDDKIPSDIPGITFVDGPYSSVAIKGNLTPGLPLITNEIRDEGGNKVAYIDWDGCIEIDNNAVDFSKAFSIAFKVKYESNPAGNNGLVTICGTRNSTWPTGKTSITERGPGFGKHQVCRISAYNESKDTGGKITAWLDGSNTLDSEVGAFKQDQWHHLVLTFDGNGAGKIYLNGEILSGTLSDGSQSAGTSARTDLFFHELTDTKLVLGLSCITATDGAAPIDKDGSTVTGTNIVPWYYKGFTKSVPTTYDNIAIFEKELTTQEVSDIYTGASVPTGIRDAKVCSDAIYPNPMMDVLFVKEQGVSAIEIYSIAGVKVLSFTNVSSGINVGSLAKGVYLINCIDANGQVIAVQKAIKK